MTLYWCTVSTADSIDRDKLFVMYFHCIYYTFIVTDLFYVFSSFSLVPSVVRPPKAAEPVHKAEGRALTALGNWDDGMKENFWGHDYDHYDQDHYDDKK